MSDTDTGPIEVTEEVTEEVPETDPALTSYAPGHGPDGPIEGYVPPAPAPPSMRDQLREAIAGLEKILEKLT